MRLDTGHSCEEKRLRRRRQVSFRPARARFHMTMDTPLGRFEIARRLAHAVARKCEAAEWHLLEALDRVTYWREELDAVLATVAECVGGVVLEIGEQRRLARLEGRPEHELSPDELSVWDV